MKFTPENITGYISGISFGESILLEDTGEIVTGWFYEMTGEDDNVYYEIPDELEDDEVEPVDPDKVEAWEEDLKQLVNEHQAAYNLSVFSVKVILDWVARFRNILPSPPE